MSYLFKYLKKEPKLVMIVTLLTIITSSLRVTHALINVSIFNALIKLQIDRFFKYVGLDIVVFAILSIFLILLQIQTTKTVQYLSIDLRKDIINQIEKKRITDFQKKDTGIYASWLTNDITTIENQGFYNILQAIQIITDPLFSIVALVQFSWTFVPLILIVSLLTVLLPQIIHKKLANAGLSTTKANERLLNVINDSLRGFTTFSIFGMERQLEKRIIGTALSVANKKIKQEKYQAVANNLAGFSNIIGQTGIQAWTGFLALNKIISIGVIGSSGNLSYNVFNSLAVIAPIWTEMTALTPIFEKYHLDNNQNSKQEGQQLTDFKFKSLSTRNLQMTFDHKRIFQHPLNIKINTNEKVGIYGQSGSGKSTLLKIISGQIQNYQGSIRLNNIEEKEISYDSLRQTAIYIDQTPYLFDDTVLYNLTLGENFPSEQINKILEKIDLADFINQLPQGLNTQIGEGGANLSGGQKQRLALARGLLRKKSLFLFDESTSNLDKKTALKVENDFLKQKDITVIFVSHQLHEENKDRFDQLLEI